MAMHEAAHAVAALRVGLPLKAVEGPNEEWGTAGSVGLTLPADYSPERYPDLAKAQIVSELAGMVTEIRLTGDLDFAGALGDIEEAFGAAEDLRGDDWPTLISECQDRAREIVRADWGSIETVADALLASSTGALGGEDVRRLIRGTA